MDAAVGAARAIFENSAGLQKQLIIITDGLETTPGAVQSVLNDCAAMRILTPPVRVCTVQILTEGDDCDFPTKEWFEECANTIDSPQHDPNDPNEPTGLFSCIHGPSENDVELTMLCEDCLCDYLNDVPPDCNSNGEPDVCEGIYDDSLDCDENGEPDDCESPGEDCNANGGFDACDIIPGDIAFLTPPDTVDVGSRPQWVAATGVDQCGETVPLDLNGDTFTDLVTANRTSGNITVLVNDGNGVFVVDSTIAVGLEPSAVAAGDFDADGDMDLAVCNRGDDSVSVLLNMGLDEMGHVQFEAAPDSPFDVVGDGPISIVAADFDDDGDVDLVTANTFGADSLTVLLNDGSASFSIAPSFPFILATPAVALFVTVADLDGDGLPDIIAGTSSDDEFTVLRNTTPPAKPYSFQSQVYDAFPTVRSMTAIDANCDGLLDLAAAAQHPGVLAIFINTGTDVNGDVTFAAPVTYTAPDAWSIEAIDVDQDKYPDLLVGRSGNSNRMRVFRNDGTGGFDAVWEFQIGASPVSIGVAPLDGQDGADFAVVEDTIAGAVRIFLNETVPPLSIDKGNDGLPNGIPDECECPQADIFSTTPLDGTIDARQPHPPDSNIACLRQGIGGRNDFYANSPEPITIDLNGVTGAENPACWDLCETWIEEVEVGPPLDANFIVSVTEVGSGIYEIFLDRPISAGHWTTITYEG
ncbi:MAG: VCBS repeat-containing protein, partial [Planctomycetes bacterium]|nr:VCBS repeat-containing protein [Planctomycetota bacterium]